VDHYIDFNQNAHHLGAERRYSLLSLGTRWQ